MKIPFFNKLEAKVSGKHLLKRKLENIEYIWWTYHFFTTDY